MNPFTKEFSKIIKQMVDLGYENINIRLYPKDNYYSVECEWNIEKETKHKMNIAELEKGTGIFSEIAEKRGHRTFTIDIDKKFSPDICKDILKVTKDDFPFVPDVIVAAIPCTHYSKAKSRGKRDLELADKITKKNLEIISWFPKCIWIIENPQTGLLKKRGIMDNIFYHRPYYDISYCKYGLPYRKQTRIWTNLSTWKPRPICKKDCKFMKGNKHIHSVGNNRKEWTEKVYTKPEDKFGFPKELCLELIKACEIVALERKYE